MSKLSKSLPYHLFVEGKNDLHVVSSLCGLHHVNQNFNIKVCESVENAIGLFRLTLTNPSAYPRIGVVLDADTDVEKRWRQLVDILKSSNKYDCDGLDLPSDGLVLYPLNDYDAVVGIWIMPNNRFEGMLDHFALICADKGDNVAVREIRKHIGWYVKGMRGASYVKRTANKITQASELIELLRGLLK